MKNILSSLFILAVAGTLSPAFSQMGGNYKWNNTGSLPSGITHSTYHSTLMNTDIGYNVYLPPKYSSSTDSYPVVYSLHGMGGNEGSNCQIYSGVLPDAISSNEILPFIVVFVNGRGNTFYSDSKNGTVKCESSIIKELIPHIDSTYRTKADRKSRAIEGISMGGFGTLLLGFKHPDIFGSIATYDAALVTWDTISQQQFDQSIPNDIFGSDKQYFLDNCYPFTFVKKNLDTIKSLGIKVRMIDGDNDVQMGPLYSYNCAMRDTLKANGISIEFKTIPGGGHGAGMSAATVKENLVFHSNNLKALATAVQSRSVSGQSAANAVCGSVKFSTMTGFHIPGNWQNSVNSVMFYDLNGKHLGQLPIGKQSFIDGSTVKKLFGSGTYLIKPVM